MMPLDRLARAAAALVLTMTSMFSQAQSWPSKPVRFVIPFPAGGSTDIVGRLIGEKLSQRLGQQFIVDNRAGAGGTIGSELVAKSAPDGYTIVMGTSSTHAIASSLYGKLPYDATRDFAPVSLLGTATIMLVVNPSVPAKNVQELVALAKSMPGKLTYASSGNGSVSHLTGEYFKSMAGIDIQHVPYKGDTPMTIDLVAGQVSMAFGTAVAFLPYVKSGKLRALAVTNGSPSPVAPQLPTVSASGLPGFEALQWFGILAPKGTPANIVAKLHDEISIIVKLPDVRLQLQQLGMDVADGTPQEFGTFIEEETVKWGKLVAQSGAKID
jgi:tripartite-type tricarboxylate transporter receptor subunit TctC